MRVRRFVCAGVVLGLAGGVVDPARAANVSTITFDTPADYTNNFLQVHGGSSVTYDGAAQRLQMAGVNTSGSIRYDSNPSDGVAAPADFLTETLSVDVTFSALNGSSVGFFTRMRTDNGQGILALLNVGGANAVQLRLFPDALYSQTQGAAFFNQSFAPVNAIAPGTPLRLVLTQTAAADPVFNLTVSDAEGLVATTGNVPFTLNDNYNGPGTVGLRLFTAAAPAAASTITVDNFAAVPEPTSVAVAGLAAVGLLAGRRRRRSR